MFFDDDVRDRVLADGDFYRNVTLHAGCRAGVGAGCVGLLGSRVRGWFGFLTAVAAGR